MHKLKIAFSNLLASPFCLFANVMVFSSRAHLKQINCVQNLKIYFPSRVQIFSNGSFTHTNVNFSSLVQKKDHINQYMILIDQDFSVRMSKCCSSFCLFTLLPRSTSL